MATPKKTTTKKPADKPAEKSTAPKKPRAAKTTKAAADAAEVKHGNQDQAAAETTHAAQAEHSDAEHQHAPKHGKYFYAVGRRKTSVANVRLFFGKAKSQVNNKEVKHYFGGFAEEVFKPLQLTGLENQVYVYANIKGGGVHSQAQALAHGIAQAVIVAEPDHRKVLKKNGMLTRDSRMKERKKPGLKRARRGPQWAKR